jgi:phosphoribosylglycinamide formyltransferase 2|tara:strand:- start:3101 stop:4237 length:1137 start_codon:yes stop_codon:yes gene_type:complete
MVKKILLLGSGELGKELTISLKRFGHYVVACDRYQNAPAMQVADHKVHFDMLDADLLNFVIREQKPDFIVPEVEAIQTETLIEVEDKGYTVIPTARAVNLTMNRDRIRNRATELGLRTAKYSYANSLEELKTKAKEIGYPVVIKPVMSSSGKGQSVCENSFACVVSWQSAMEGMRGDRKQVIVEEFIDFDYEITLLTVKQHHADTVFCPPIGHVQKDGDYRYSWQPQDMSDAALRSAQEMAKIITDDLGGAGLFGVEFFIKNDEVIFSELSPRPHDTGMVTLFTQNLSEFNLHARALLGYPIPPVELKHYGVSHVILADNESNTFDILGIEKAMATAADVRIFGKPTTKKNRRMGVVFDKNLGTAAYAASQINFKYNT